MSSVGRRKARYGRVSTSEVPVEVSYRRLKTLNLVAAIIFSATFFAVLGIAIWAQVSDSATSTLNPQLTVDFVEVTSEDPVTLSVNTTVLGTYPLIWLEIVFPFVTAVFHWIIWGTAYFDNYYFPKLGKGRNPLRWVEYAITASVMTWSICQISGITNLFALLNVAVMGNVALQFCGFWMESANEDRSRGERVNWIPTLVGWFIFSVQWATIITYFIKAVVSATNPPWFLYTVVIVLFSLYADFGILQILHYAWCGSFFSNPYTYEFIYIILSLVSKLSLEILIIVSITTSGVIFS